MAAAVAGFRPDKPGRLTGTRTRPVHAWNCARQAPFSPNVVPICAAATKIRVAESAPSLYPWFRVSSTAVRRRDCNRRRIRLARNGRRPAGGEVYVMANDSTTDETRGFGAAHGPAARRSPLVATGCCDRRGKPSCKLLQKAMPIIGCRMAGAPQCATAATPRMIRSKIGAARRARTPDRSGAVPRGHSARGCCRRIAATARARSRCGGPALGAKGISIGDFSEAPATLAARSPRRLTDIRVRQPAQASRPESGSGR